MSGLLAACAPTRTTPPSTAESSEPPGIQYLALGDSYTIGSNVSRAARWPIQLVADLQARGIPINAPKIIAEDGWTTGDLSKGIKRDQPRETYGLVTLLIGVNNQYRGYGVEVYRTEFRVLLDKAITLAGDNPLHVIVLSIPDWSVTPFAWGRDQQQIASEIQALNRVNRQEAITAGAQYIDITSESRRAGQDRSLLTHDGLHPSASMYKAWVRDILPTALTVLHGTALSYSDLE